ncbi:hypothetical protein [uncultured Treponema sp.]|uniref:hypothetical protein n=1 Tax=uncultured Treponema sp. TaxID=162155 RepID=UPI0025DF089F|nr:hypothetical protein [uncultured Treponema sp.]
MKALKKICTVLMLLAFAFVFASCSNGSDSDDDDSSSNGLPSSVGKNVLAGNSYQYSKADDDKTKTITYAFKDDTVTETKVEQKTGKSAETDITVYNYTYNANTGLLYMKIVSWTSDGVKMTSMNEVYAYLKKAGEVETVEEAKEYFGDQDIFAEKISMCYFVKNDGNILLGNYFDDDEDVKSSNFNYEEETTLRVKFDSEKIELNGATKTDWKIELDAKEETFSGSDIAGSYTVKAKAKKTLKELNGDDKLNEANGYIMVKFSKLPSEMSSALYNMETGTEYKFIFDLDCDEYTKQKGKKNSIL